MEKFLAERIQTASPKGNDMKKNHLILLIAACALSACAVGPDYVRPSTNVPVKFKEAKGKSVIAPHKTKGWKVAEPQDARNRGEWWRIFNDSELNSLEAKLNASIKTILNAYENYRQALALVDEARAAYFPTILGSLNLTRQKSGGGSTSFVSSSTTGTTSSGTATTGASSSSSSSITNSHVWLVNASWVPDIWGLVRRTVEANSDSAQASAALYASTRLSSQASLAQYYFELRGLDNIQKLLDNTVRDDKKALQLTKNQYAAGTASLADMTQAQAVLEAAAASAINNGILRGQYEHAIAVLIGLPPSQFGISARSHTITPPAIPLEVPSVLLERRPDIAQAERLMAAANAQIGVAVSAYFPALTLSGALSSTAQGLGPLFSFPVIGWSLGAGLADTIFDGGLRSATVSAAKAGYLSSVATYRQTVLAAFQNVEDNLVSLRILNQQAVVEKQAVASARLALKLVLDQYKAGTIAYSSVITAQVTAFNAEQTAANVDYLRMTSAVGLITALGGGWNVDEVKALL